MPIKEGDFIKLSYSGSTNGRIFDTTDEATATSAGIHNPNATYGPVTIRVGSKHVILGLDEDLVDKDVGTEHDIPVKPDKAFGERDPKRIQSFPKSKFKEKPTRGATVKVEEIGEGIVVDVIGSRVIVDFNAPLAGQTLTYHYKIEEMVDEILDKMKGLIQLYAGREMEVVFGDGNVTITLPPGITYDRRWLLWRGRIIHEALEFIPDIKEITLVEHYKRPEKTET